MMKIMLIALLVIDAIVFAWPISTSSCGGPYDQFNTCLVVEK